MRYLIVLLFPFLMASNWVSTSDLILIQANSSGATVFMNQGNCQQLKAEPCWQIDGLDPRKYSIQSVREGNFGPISNQTDCPNATACALEISDIPAKCGDASFEAFWGDIDGDSTEIDGISQMDDLEAWCFQRDFVDKLKLDATLEASVNAANAIKEADRSNRESKSQARSSDASSCVSAVNDTSAMTPADIKICLDILIKEVFQKGIATSDL